MRMLMAVSCVWKTLGFGILVAPGHLAWPAVDLDPSQDTFERPVLAFVVSGSEGGIADGMYSCADTPEALCVHLRKPQLRLKKEVIFDDPDGGMTHNRRANVDGATIIYVQGRENPLVSADVANTADEQEWIRVGAEDSAPRGVPTLAVEAIRDTGCLGISRQDLETGRHDVPADEATIAAMLGDIYTHGARLGEAAECYSVARIATPPGRQHCHLSFTLCTVVAKQARGAGRTRDSQRSVDRKEAECLSSLLLEEEADCSRSEAATAHLSVGLYRLSAEWNVSSALDHFLAASAQREQLLLEGGIQQEREIGRDNLGWGAVWLTQAIQGRVEEASNGFVANATAFGRAWAGTHLQSWRRHLGQKSSGIGMAGVVEGAKRLIIASLSGDFDGERGEEEYLSTFVDLHIALARTLLLQGAFEQAEGHVRAVEQLTTTAHREGSRGAGVSRTGGNADRAIAALLLEITLLSRTPVVLESEEQAISLRKELLVDLARAEKEGNLSGLIPSPLDVGVRAQFLLTYQGLDDKAATIALARTFDKASGGTLSYCSSHLLLPSEPGDDANLNGDGNIKQDTLKERDIGQPAPLWGQESANNDTVARHSAMQLGGTADGSSRQRVAQIPAASAAFRVKTTPETRNDRRPIRVGFLSTHFRWHSVGRLTVGLLEELSRSGGVKVFVIHASIHARAARERSDRRDTPQRDDGVDGYNDSAGTDDGDKEDPIRARLKASGASIIWLPPTTIDSAAAEAVVNSTGEANRMSGVDHALQEAREKIAALKLDALVFGDVGMDALTTGLAHARLSPVQVAFWGHPGTTGLSTMDFFITSDLFEPKGNTKDGDAADILLGRYSKRSRSSRVLYSDRNCNARGVETELELDAASDDMEIIPERGDGCAGRRYAAAKAGSRQGAFSEQLVRLNGLGINFDDPVQMFRSPDEEIASPRRGRLPIIGSSDEQQVDGGTRQSAPNNGQTAAKGDRMGAQKSFAQHASSGGKTRPTAKENSPRPRLYVCVQSLMKMHPAFDAAIAGILAEDPLAHVVLLRDSRQLLWHSRFRRRLRLAVDAAEERKNITRLAATAGRDDHRETGNSSFPRCSTSSSIHDDSSLLVPMPCPSAPPPALNPNAEKAVGNDPPGEFAINVGTSTASTVTSPQRVAPEKRTPAPGQLWSRVRFVSSLSGRDFFDLQCRADVVLDPFPFGGGVTTLEALSCGTPVVSAGALQSVHRLAEGMIFSMAEELEGAETTMEMRDKSGNDYAMESGGAEGCDARERLRNSFEGCLSSECEHDGKYGREGEGPESESFSFALVENLLASTKGDYVKKAVAVASPGPLRERVRRALQFGSEHMMRGNGNVALDWERFLRNAVALSSTAETTTNDPE